MTSSPQPKQRLFVAAGLALVCGVLAAGVAAAASPGSAERQGTGLPTGTGTSTGTSPTPPDQRVDFSVKIRKSQTLGPPVTLQVRCAEVCKATVSGKLYVTVRKKGRRVLKARQFTIPPKSSPMGVGESKTFKLRLPKNGRRLALRSRGKTRAKISVLVQDLAGNSATQVDTVTLKRKRKR